MFALFHARQDCFESAERIGRRIALDLHQQHGFCFGGDQQIEPHVVFAGKA
jgi:hypothetical protein